VRFPVLAAAGACLALAACGDDSDSSPDSEKVESGLAGDVEEATGTRDVTVACPDDVAEGDVCDVTAAGGIRAQVKVTRLEGDEVEGEVVPP
jgi:hypothetical protein